MNPVATVVVNAALETQEYFIRPCIYVRYKACTARSGYASKVDHVFIPHVIVGSRLLMSLLIQLHVLTSASHHLTPHIIYCTLSAPPDISKQTSQVKAAATFLNIMSDSQNSKSNHPSLVGGHAQYVKGLGEVRSPLYCSVIVVRVNAEASELEDLCYVASSRPWSHSPMPLYTLDSNVLTRYRPVLQQ